MENIIWNPNWNCEPARVVYNRMMSLLTLYENLKDEQYPFMMNRVIGFIPIKVNTKEELVGRIKELCDILNIQIELINEINKDKQYKLVFEEDN